MGEDIVIVVMFCVAGAATDCSRRGRTGRIVAAEGGASCCCGATGWGVGVGGGGVGFLRMGGGGATLRFDITKRAFSADKSTPKFVSKSLACKKDIRTASAFLRLAPTARKR